MKVFALILSLFVASQMAFAKSKKKTKAPKRTSFEQCVHDIKRASFSLNKAGKNVDKIFKDNAYEGFNYFQKLIKTGKKRYLRSVGRRLDERGERINSYKYGLPLIASIQASLPVIKHRSSACRRSCAKLDSKKQYERNLQIKCNQIGEVTAGFEHFVVQQNEAALSPAINALATMKGTNRNYQIVKSSEKALNDEVMKAQATYRAELNAPAIEADEAVVQVAK